MEMVYAYLYVLALCLLELCPLALCVLALCLLALCLFLVMPIRVVTFRRIVCCRHHRVAIQLCIDAFMTAMISFQLLRSEFCHEVIALL